MHYPVRSMVTETNVRRTATRVGRLTVVQCSGGSKGKEGREGREGGKGRDLKGKEGRKRQMGREGKGREGKGRKVGCCCEAVSSTCRPEAEIKKKAGAAASKAERRQHRDNPALPCIVQCKRCGVPGRDEVVVVLVKSNAEFR